MIDSLVYDGTSIFDEDNPSGRRLARMSGGPLWCVYVRNNGKDNIFIAKSTDAGATWGNEEQISFLVGNTSENHPAIAVDSHDNLHCVWSENLSGAVTIRYSKRTFATGIWSAPVTISDAQTTTTTRVCIVLDSSDNIYVIYHGIDSASPTHRYLWFTIYSGGAWSVPAKVSTTESNGFLSAAVDSTDSVLVIWMNRNYDISFTKYSGGVWTDDPPVTNINNIALEQTNPEIAVDSHDNVWASWAGKTWGLNPGQFQVVVAKRTSLGVWGAPTPVLDDGKESYDASIAVEKNDQVNVVFTYYVALPIKTFVLKQANYNGAWGIPFNVTATVTTNPLVLDLPRLLWANRPVIGGTRTNVINGTMFAYIVQDGMGGYAKRFYSLPGTTLPIVQTDPATGVF